MNNGKKNSRLENNSGKLSIDESRYLNVIELFLLHTLRSFPQGIVRFPLLHELNDYLVDKNELSRGGFYNSLKRLEKMGLVEVSDRTKSEPASVSTTKIANETLKELSKFLIFLSIDYSKVYTEILPELNKKLIDSVDIPLDSILVITFEKSFDRLISIIKSLSKDISILCSEEIFSKYYKNYSENFHLTEIRRNMIREPDDVFDVTILSNYNKEADFSNYLLKEAFRITKPKGKILVFATADLPKTDNFMINSLITTLQESKFFFTSSKEHLKKDLEDLKLENLEVMDIKGILVGFGDVPD